MIRSRPSSETRASSSCSNCCRALLSRRLNSTTGGCASRIGWHPLAARWVVSFALGHPLGATGAMITGIALDELERSNKSTALVTLCIGGGMGTATIIERV